MSKGKSILNLLANLSNEKNIGMEKLIEILESSIAVAVRKQFTPSSTPIQVRFDRAHGEFRLVRIWHILADDQPILDPTQELHVTEASARFQSSLPAGSQYTEVIDYDLSRIVVKQIKQDISKLIQTQVSQRILAELNAMRIPVVRGVVKHVLPHKILFQLNDHELECIIPCKYLLTQDRYHIGDHIECHVVSYHIGASGQLNLSLSRRSTGMLEFVITQTVPELEEQKVEICQLVRLPSVRSKVVVRALVPDIDPVGALIGYQGKRINAISKKLGWERIDVILYDPEVLTFTRNAYQGLDILELVEQEDSSLLVVVPQEQIPMFIGSAGSNVSLTSQLIGRKLKIIAQT